jgi:hypothetical protein
MPRKGPHRYDAYARAHKDDTLKAVQARRQMVKKLGLAAVRGKDVDHVKSIKAGGSNHPKNLRLRSPKANRGDKTFYN